MATIGSIVRDGARVLASFARAGVRILAGGCSCCGRVGYYEMLPCDYPPVTAESPGPCQRAPYRRIYVREDVRDRATGLTIRELRRRTEQEAAARTTATGVLHRAEVGLRWAGYCYVFLRVSSVADGSFNLPIGVSPNTDADPYTVDVIDPPAEIDASAAVLSADQPDRFCAMADCAAGVSLCIARRCKGQQGGHPEVWVCGQNYATGSVFLYDGTCYCIDCGTTRDYQAIVNAGGVIVPGVAPTYQGCTECANRGLPQPPEEVCPDGRACRLTRPCSETYSGTATVTETNASGGFSRIFEYRFLPDGTFTTRVRLFSDPTFGTVIEDYTLPPDPSLRVASSGFPACRYGGCQPSSASFPNPGFNDGGLPVPGSAFNDAGGPEQEGAWYGVRVAACDCTSWAYGWQSHLFGGSGGSRFTSSGLVRMIGRCSPLPGAVESECPGRSPRDTDPALPNPDEGADLP